MRGRDDIFSETNLTLLLLVGMGRSKKLNLHTNQETVPTTDEDDDVCINIRGIEKFLPNAG